MAVSSATAASGLTGLNQDQFMQLFLAQMRNQDPLTPTSSSDMMNQLAQMTSVSSMQQLSQNFSDLLSLQQLTQGSNLVGRTVTYQAQDAKAPAQGVVTSVSVQNGSVVVNLGQTAVPLSQVTSVTATPS